MILKQNFVLTNHTHESPPPTMLKFQEIASFYIPKPNLSKPIGEDAHFVFSDKNAAGVADGVGGWASKGIDAGDYARELMNNCFTAIALDGDAAVMPHLVLADAHSRTAAAGSSTACVVSLDGECLRAANLGDSGFAIFRNNRVFYRSPVQRRGFNCPYQMGTGDRCEKPAEAWRGEIRVAAGDVVVVGTDGLWDNVFEREIEEVLEAVEAATAGQLAGILAEAAYYKSVDKFKDGPFAAEARRAGWHRRGGKVDDITVIVARVTAAATSG